MYKYFMIIGLSVVVLGWIVYGIYNYIATKREEKQPKARSQKYKQAQESMAEYAKKMANFEKKKYNKSQ